MAIWMSMTGAYPRDHDYSVDVEVSYYGHDWRLSGTHDGAGLLSLEAVYLVARCGDGRFTSKNVVDLLHDDAITDLAKEAGFKGAVVKLAQ